MELKKEEWTEELRRINEKGVKRGIYSCRREDIDGAVGGRRKV